jgi:acyl phosphate:glycerol-3-phosphate acyltransferase
MTTTALLVAAGYLLGSVPFGYWLVRAAKGVDVRQIGSGNIGASNVWRTFGWRYGVPVMLFDVAKGLVPALVATELAGSLAGVLAGGAAMLGHARPLFLRFEKGGKAVATAGGAFLGVAPVVGLIGAGVWIAVFALTRYASLASMISACSLPVLAWVLAEPWPVTAFGAAAAVVVVVLHRQNIRRLTAGTESRAKPWRQLLRRVTARAEPSSGPSP